MTVKTVGELREKMRWASDSCPLNGAFETRLDGDGFSIRSLSPLIAISGERMDKIAEDIQNRIGASHRERGLRFYAPGTRWIKQSILASLGLPHDKQLEKYLPLE